MNKEIVDKTAKVRKIQKIGKNYIKKLENKKLAPDKIDKGYLRSIFPESENFYEEYDNF